MNPTRAGGEAVGEAIGPSTAEMPDHCAQRPDRMLTAIIVAYKTPADLAWFRPAYGSGGPADWVSGACMLVRRAPIARTPAERRLIRRVPRTRTCVMLHLPRGLRAR